MKVIVMAAGAGSRYAAEGFTVSKPLVEFKGRPMIDLVLSNLLKAGVNSEDIIVVGTPSVVRHIEQNSAGTLVKTIKVPVLQNGPGMSVLLAGGYIKQDEYVVLADSDTIIPVVAIKQMITQGNHKVACKYIDGPTKAYSTVDLDESSGLVTRIEEKTGSSSLICVGMYAFGTWGTFVHKAAQSILDRSGEVYIAPLLSHLLPTPVFIDEWINLGTPTDLMKASK